MDVKTDAHKTTLRSRPLIFLDLEFTGLKVQQHEIIEIGALKTAPKKPFKAIAKFEIKVRPENIQNADKEALKITGYSEDSWAQSLTLKEALAKLDEFAEEGVLVGYNVSMDWAGLDKAYFFLGRQDPFYYHRIDVMSMAYGRLFSKRSLKRFSLGEVCKYLGIKQQKRHRALDDAYATYLVFKKLMNIK